MKSVIGAASATALLLSLGACATVVRGTTTDFKVASTPPGASVTTSTGFSCSPTPCVIRKMIRKEAFDATVTLAGYKPVTRHVQSLVEGGGAAGAVGNVMIGGVIGIAVDAKHDRIEARQCQHDGDEAHAGGEFGEHDLSLGRR